MFYLKQVRESYKEAIRLHPTIDEGLKASLRINERVPEFIDNLAIEIEKVAALRRKKGKPNLTPEQVKGMVYDVTNIFVAGIMAKAKQMHESDMERVIREQKAQQQKDLEQTAAGKISGDYEEFGIISQTEERTVE